MRPIPMGRKNWLFCWSEVGAEAVATLQGLIVTCRLHDIDPHDYLVDVLQRIDRQPPTVGLADPAYVMPKAVSPRAAFCPRPKGTGKNAGESPVT